MTKEHTVKSFEEELRELADLVLEMGRACETQVDNALLGLTGGDVDLAERVVARDEPVDALRDRVEVLVQGMLARRQPMASDLREIVSCGRIARELERLGDHAKNIARRIPAALPVPEATAAAFAPLFEGTRAEVGEMVAVLIGRDVARGRALCAQDKRLDAVFEGLFDHLLGVMRDDRTLVGRGTRLLFVAKSCERIGDHATNVAEDVIYWVTGELVRSSRS